MISPVRRRKNGGKMRWQGKKDRVALLSSPSPPPSPPTFDVERGYQESSTIPSIPPMDDGGGHTPGLPSVSPPPYAWRSPEELRHNGALKPLPSPSNIGGESSSWDNDRQRYQSDYQHTVTQRQHQQPRHIRTDTMESSPSTAEPPRISPTTRSNVATNASGALQFVPAYAESTQAQVIPGSDSFGKEKDTLNTKRNWRRKKADGSENFNQGLETELDRMAQAQQASDDESQLSDSRKSPAPAAAGIFRRRKTVRTDSNPVSPIQSQRKSAPRPASLNNLSSVSDAGAGTKKQSKVSRLASLFSSRAVVKTTAPPLASKAAPSFQSVVPPPPKQAAAPFVPTVGPAPPSVPMRRVQSHSAVPEPASPTRSSEVSGSSTGYVGWPGTQDKRGKSVEVPSSYDESDDGVGRPFDRADIMDDAAAVQYWMNNADEVDSVASADRNNRRLSTQQNGLGKDSLGDVEDDEDSAVTGDMVGSAHHGRPPSISHRRRMGADRTRAEASEFETVSLMSTPMSLAPSPSPSPTNTRGTQDSSLPVHMMAVAPMEDSRSESFASSYRRSDFIKVKSALSGGSVANRRSSSAMSETPSTGGISIQNLFDTSAQRSMPTTKPRDSQQQTARRGSRTFFDDREDPWDIDSTSVPPSSPGTSENDSSTFGPSQQKDVGIGIIDLDASASEQRLKSTGRELPSRNPRGPTTPEPQPPTEAALAVNDRYSPSPRALNSMNVKGYRGFIDKTKDVPNLMDAVDSESASTSTRATSTFSGPARGLGLQIGNGTDGRFSRRSSAVGSTAETESDVFDGLVQKGHDAFEAFQAEHFEQTQNGIDVQKRKPQLNISTDYDSTDSDQFGFLKGPAYFNGSVASSLSGSEVRSSVVLEPMQKMVSIQESNHPHSLSPRRPRSGVLENSLHINTGGTTTDTGSASSSSISDSDEGGPGDLSKYYVEPHVVKKLVRKYRKMFRLVSEHKLGEELDVEEDAKKAFALLEMRSRIMEKDIERGLERQGGTVTVDDIVLTPYNQAAMRVRDAVIVSKAWRDGASPRDVITASLLTMRDKRSFHIRRSAPTPRRRPGAGDNSSVNNSFDSKVSGISGDIIEEVRWVDDIEFLQFRCPSLGPRCMRGFEMFTIGDCQSILLKLTNERCMLLREDLNAATACQIEAEELLKLEEAGTGEDGMMTVAEMEYLSAMERVKTISRKLVIAEKAFRLVRERIEKLVAKYESLLVKIEASSVSSFEESEFTADYDSSQYDSEENDRERQVLARRAQRAELRAEVAAREALLAKQEALMIREEKERELEELQQKLADLQSEATSMAERERSSKIAFAIATAQGSATSMHSDHRRTDGQRRGLSAADMRKVEGVKQKFRDRMVERMRRGPPSRRQYQDAGAVASPTGFDPSLGGGAAGSPNVNRTPRHRQRLTGEEMFQHLDFYERSLKSVEQQQV